MKEWAELGRALETLTVSGRGEIREDGKWFAELAGLHCEVHTRGKNPLVHLWTGERNLTRRIVRIREQSENRIVLEVQRFGCARPGRLEFLRTDSRRTAGRIGREEFRIWLRRFLGERFPDATVESLTTAPDLENSLSGLYVRGRMREGRRTWAVLAVSPSENAAAVEGVLASGILWLDWTRAHAQRQAVEGMRLSAPEGASCVVSQRALGLSPAARTEIFEFRERDSWTRRVDCADAGNLESWLVPRQEAEASLEAAHRAIARIHPLALHMPPAGDDITVRSIPQTGEVALCFRGLEFGRWSREGISFGLGDARERLSEATEPALDALMRGLDTYRSPNASDANHPLYRAAPERWIETLVVQDPTRLDAQLDQRHF